MSIRRTLAVRSARRRINGVPDPTLTALAASLRAQTNADAGFVSFTTTDRAYVVGAHGLPDDMADGNQGIPVKESFCAHLVDSGNTNGLIVNTPTHSRCSKRAPPSTHSDHGSAHQSITTAKSSAHQE